MSEASDLITRVPGGRGYEDRVEHAVQTALDAKVAEIRQLREGLDAAIRAAKLALFVINKQGAMPNSSWESGFNSDVAKATAARDGGWKCAARAQNTGPNDPADCAWPGCGCDPYANKVIEALQESGTLIAEERTK